MTRLPLSLPLSLLLLAGCLPGDFEIGAVTVCMDGARSEWDDTELDLDGTVAAVGVDACGASVTVDDGVGEPVTVSFGATDDDQRDVTPTPTLQVGDAVHLHFRSRLVWGTVAGFSITDASGLRLAVDEGTWGSALTPEHAGGLAVQRGDEVIGRRPGDCQPQEGYTLVFAGDDTVEVEPVAEDEVRLGGQDTRVLAVAAWVYGESATCSISDTTDFASWVGWR